MNNKQEGILFTIDCLNHQKYNFDYNLEVLIEEAKELQQENKQLKKQKDDVTQYIKKHEKDGDLWSVKVTDDLLRMLGEIDNE